MHFSVDEVDDELEMTMTSLPPSLSLDKVDDELEMTMVCHRPEGLDKLESQTNFTKRELQGLYRGFKNVREPSSLPSFPPSTSPFLSHLFPYSFSTRVDVDFEEGNNTTQIQVRFIFLNTITTNIAALQLLFSKVLGGRCQEVIQGPKQFHVDIMLSGESKVWESWPCTKIQGISSIKLN